MQPYVIDMKQPDGLIYGFVLRSDRPPEAIASAEAAQALLHDPSAAGTVSLWLHFNLGDMRSQHWIRQCPSIPAPARDLLLGDDAHIRFGRLADGVGGVLGDLHFDFDSDPDKLDVLRLYCGPDLLVTARQHPIKATDQLRRQLERAEAPIASSSALLICLLDELIDLFEQVTQQLAESIDTAEDRILADHHLEVSASLAKLHRVLARLRRHLGANRSAVARGAHGLPPWFDSNDAAKFTVATERLEAVVNDLSLVEDRARLLQQEIARRVSEDTNRNLYFLSIVTALFLPVTLISGIFGMNVPGLPWMESSHGFWIVIVLMLLVAVITVLVLRWRRIF